MKIILDAMGGDNAPQAPVLGAIEAVKRYNADIILVGRGQEILEVLKKNGLDTLPEGVEIAHADDVKFVIDIVPISPVFLQKGFIFRLVFNDQIRVAPGGEPGGHVLHVL